jgi:Asp-tRNA(Asn)/Glu-tRNA(Gln) amidotransferase B subunit
MTYEKAIIKAQREMLKAKTIELQEYKKASDETIGILVGSLMKLEEEKRRFNDIINGIMKLARQQGAR